MRASIVAWATVLAFTGWNGRVMAQECAAASPLADAFEPVAHALPAPVLARAGRIGDRVAMVGGVLVGGAMLLGAATVPVIAAAVVVSAWQVGRAAARLIARHRNGETLSLRDAGARAAWLAALAGGATIGAAGIHLAALAILAKPATELSVGLGAAKRIDRARDWLRRHFHHDLSPART